MKRYNIMVIAFLFIASLIPDGLSASEKVWSYSMEEMYSMAMSFTQIRESHEIDDASKYLKASEFKGYIAAVLDNSESYDECKNKYTVNDIALGTAVMMTLVPLNRSNTASVNVHVGIAFACKQLHGLKK